VSRFGKCPSLAAAPGRGPGAGAGSRPGDPPAEGVRASMPLVLLGSLACTGVGQTLLYAVLPLASREVGLGEARSAGVFALSALCWTLASPVWGRVCDRAGALPVLIAGMLGQAASNLGGALVLAAAPPDRRRCSPGCSRCAPSTACSAAASCRRRNR